MGKKETAANTTIAAATSAAAAALAVNSTPGESAALAVAAVFVATTLQESVRCLLFNRAERRWQSFAREYILSDVPPVECAARIDQDAADPRVQALLLDCARAMADALADDVVPVLARMTREYRRAGFPADGFFRGFRRLLTDVDDEELASLRQFTDIVCGIAVAQGRSTVELQYFPVAPAVERQSRSVERKLTYLRPTTSAERAADSSSPQNQRLVIEESPPHVQRLFQLLKVNGLAEDSRSGGVGSVSGPEVIVLETLTVRRLRDLLRQEVATGGAPAHGSSTGHGGSSTTR